MGESSSFSFFGGLIARPIGVIGGALVFWRNDSYKSAYIEGGDTFVWYVVNAGEASLRAEVTASGDGFSSVSEVYYLSRFGSSEENEVVSTSSTLPVGYQISANVDYGWVVGNTYMSCYVQYAVASYEE